MKRKLISLIGIPVIVILAMVFTAQIPAFGQETVEPEGNRTEKTQDSLGMTSGGKPLEGAWKGTVTFRVCPTGAAIRSFPSMNTFERAGTMHEFGLGSVPLNRSPAYGVWVHLSDQRYYSNHQIYRFNADGSYSGYVIARRYIELDRRGQNYTASTTTEIYDPNGVLLMAGCATEVASRFEL